jgi:hypothetical protein
LKEKEESIKGKISEKVDQVEGKLHTLKEDMKSEMKEDMNIIKMNCRCNTLKKMNESIYIIFK